MLYLPEIILTIDGPIVMPKMYLGPRQGIPIGGVLGSHTYQKLMIQNTVCGVPFCCWWACFVVLVQWAWLALGKSVWGVGQGIKLGLIPYVGHLVLASVPVEGWVFVPYEHGLLNGPDCDIWFTTHCEEIFQFGMMTWGVGMGRGCFEILLKFLPKVPYRLLYVLLIALQPSVHVLLYYCTYLDDVPVLGGH